ncbi:hypothetical protein LCGC14_2340740 [marine sediment metagenome]|uniref:Uncharacterized protein n=1 Tax=marine sediment metagenome TaxID=412755 RepID=A0A0F9CC05_9ZZZZ
MIEKKEIQNALKQYEAMLFDLEASTNAMKQKVIYTKERILEMIDDPMPEEAKEVIEAVK